MSATMFLSVKAGLVTQFPAAHRTHQAAPYSPRGTTPDTLRLQEKEDYTREDVQKRFQPV